MMKHVSFATFATLSSLRLLLCAVHTGSLCLYVLRCVCNPEAVCYTVMQRHEAQRCKRLRATTRRGRFTHGGNPARQQRPALPRLTSRWSVRVCLLMQHHVSQTDPSLSPLRGRALASVPSRHGQERLQSGLQ